MMDYSTELFSLEVILSEDLVIANDMIDNVIIKRDFYNSNFLIINIKFKILIVDYLVLKKYLNSNNGLVKGSLNVTSKIDGSDDNVYALKKNYDGLTGYIVSEPPNVDEIMLYNMPAINEDSIVTNDSHFTVAMSLVYESDINNLPNEPISGCFGVEEPVDISTLIMAPFKNVNSLFMSKPDTLSVENLLIPSMGFNQYLGFLRNQFPIYKNGFNVYSENGILYILNKENDVSIKSDTKVVNFNVLSSDEMAYEVGRDITDKSCLYIINEDIHLDSLSSSRNDFGKPLSVPINRVNEIDCSDPDMKELRVVEASDRDIYLKNIAYDHKRVTVKGLLLDISPHSEINLLSRRYSNTYRVSMHMLSYSAGTCINVLDLVRVITDDKVTEDLIL